MAVGTTVGAAVAIGATVGVAVAVGAIVGVAVAVGATAGVAVAVGATVGVAVAIGATVGVAVAIGAGSASGPPEHEMVNSNVTVNKVIKRIINLPLMYLVIQKAHLSIVTF